jgi:hypothetical protein
MKKLLAGAAIGIMAMGMMSMSFADEIKTVDAVSLTDFEDSVHITFGDNLEIIGLAIEEVMPAQLEEGCIITISSTLDDSLKITTIGNYEEFIESLKENLKPIGKRDDLLMKSFYEKAMELDENGDFEKSSEYFERMNKVLGRYFK